MLVIAGIYEVTNFLGVFDLAAAKPSHSTDCILFKNCILFKMQHVQKVQLLKNAIVQLIKMQLCNSMLGI